MAELRRLLRRFGSIHTPELTSYRHVIAAAGSLCVLVGLVYQVVSWNGIIQARRKRLTGEDDDVEFVDPVEHNFNIAARKVDEELANLVKGTALLAEQRTQLMADNVAKDDRLGQHMASSECAAANSSPANGAVGRDSSRSDPRPSVLRQEEVECREQNEKDDEEENKKKTKKKFEFDVRLLEERITKLLIKIDGVGVGESSALRQRRREWVLRCNDISANLAGLHLQVE